MPFFKDLVTAVKDIGHDISDSAKAAAKDIDAALTSDNKDKDKEGAPKEGDTKKEEPAPATAERNEEAKEREVVTATTAKEGEAKKEEPKESAAPTGNAEVDGTIASLRADIDKALHDMDRDIHNALKSK